jgi:formylglycine-generating enzyme
MVGPLRPDMRAMRAMRVSKLSSSAAPVMVSEVSSTSDSPSGVHRGAAPRIARRRGLAGALLLMALGALGPIGSNGSVAQVRAEAGPRDAGGEATAKPGPSGGEADAGCAAVPDDMKCIPEGEFVRGSDEREADQKPEEKIWLSTFFLDTYEVTNQQWRACVAAGTCRKHAGPAYKGFSAPRQPIMGISWFDARDFCAWQGKRLPTEAEWEKAARGPGGAEHSWGDERATCKRAIVEERGEKGCGLGEPPKGATAPVGSRPAGAYGLFDMAGNSWEWVQDWYTKSYAACGEACRGRDPKGPCDGAAECPGYRHRGVRGGSWWWPAKYASGSWRRAHLPGNKPFHHFGFRCARSPATQAATTAATGKPE